MDEASILAELTEIFREVFDNDSLILTAETSAEDVEGWDSMNHITIVVESERRFNVKFRTTEIEGLKNVGEFVALIEAKKG